MQLRRSTGLVAGLLALGLLTSSPAVAAGPASVTVRVEGGSQTLIPRSALTTQVRDVNKSGQPGETCTGTSAFGALDQAAGGDLTASWNSQYHQYFIDAIKGERPDASDPNRGSYWSFWLNGKGSFAGLCDAELQSGDDVLIFRDCYGTGCVNPTPLRLTGVPATARPGGTATVKVEDLAYDGTATPASGATVTAGSQTVATGPDGTAVITFAGSGPVGVRATKPDKVRSATESTCVTNGADGACGTTAPPPVACATNGADGRCGTVDRTPPAVRLLKAYDHWYYSRRHAPRTLRGTAADPSGIRAIEVRFKRQRGKACASYSAGTERWVKRSCKRNAVWFGVGDRESWSYLMPDRLRAGRYTLDVRATDKAGNVSVLERGRSRVGFRVL
jgi:hypothetical protein